MEPEVSLQALLKDPVADPPSKYTKRTKGPFILPSLEGLEVENGYLFPLRHICLIICMGTHN